MPGWRWSARPAGCGSSRRARRRPGPRRIGRRRSTHSHPNLSAAAAVGSCRSWQPGWRRSSRWPDRLWFLRTTGPTGPKPGPPSPPAQRRATTPPKAVGANGRPATATAALTRPTTAPTTRPASRPTTAAATRPASRPTTRPTTRTTTHPTTRPTTVAATRASAVLVPVRPPPSPPDLDDRIGTAINRGVDYLLGRLSLGRLPEAKGGDGTPAGADALAVYAVLQSARAVDRPDLGVDGPVAGRLLDPLRRMPMAVDYTTYDRSLRAAALAVYDRPADRAALRADAAFLIGQERGGAYTYRPLRRGTPQFAAAPPRRRPRRHVGQLQQPVRRARRLVGPGRRGRGAEPVLGTGPPALAGHAAARRPVGVPAPATRPASCR